MHKHVSDADDILLNRRSAYASEAKRRLSVTHQLVLECFSDLDKRCICEFMQLSEVQILNVGTIFHECNNARISDCTGLFQADRFQCFRGKRLDSLTSNVFQLL